MEIERAKSLILDAKRKGEGNVILFGGEPTIHPHFFEIIKFIKDVGLEFSLNTNLRMFSSKEFTKRVLDWDPIFIQTSIHGHCAKLHDYLTRTSGSFEQTIQGIRNILEYGFDPRKLITDTVITKQNMYHLKDIVKLILGDLKLPKLKFSFMEIEGKAEDNVKLLLPEFSKAYPHIDNAVSEVRRLGGKLFMEKGPLCFCPDEEVVFYIYERYLAEVRGYVKPDSCSRCKSNNVCNGVHPNYRKFYDLDEISPKKMENVNIIKR